MLPPKNPKLVCDNFLDQHREILKSLNKLGKVNIVGSYGIDVMYDLDIDIHVIMNNFDLKKIYDAYSTIIKKENFYQSNFINTHDFIEYRKLIKSKEKMLAYLKGVYIGFIHPVTKNLYPLKMDIWIYDKNHTNSSIDDCIKYTKMLINQPSKKKLIVKFKKKLFDENKRILHFGLNGKKIYQGVIEEGIENLEELIKWNEKREI